MNAQLFFVDIDCSIRHCFGGVVVSQFHSSRISFFQLALNVLDQHVVEVTLIQLDSILNVIQRTFEVTPTVDFIPQVLVVLGCVLTGTIT